MATIISQDENTSATPNRQQGGQAAKTVRKVNVPLLLGTILVGAIALGGLWAWRNFQVSRTSRVFLARAESFEAEQQWREAALYIHRYLQLSPDDKKARVKLAEVYDQSVQSLNQKPRAVELYYQALGVTSDEDKAKKNELRLRLASLLLDLRRFAEAENETRELAKSGDREAFRLRALALYGQSQIGSLRNGAPVGEALQAALYQVGTYAPLPEEQDVQLSAILARVWRNSPELLSSAQKQENGAALTASQREAQGDQVIGEMLRANPTSVKAHLAAFAYQSQYSLDGADANLEQAVALGPDDLTVRLTAGAHFGAEAVKAQKAGQEPNDVRDLWQAAAGHYQLVVDEIDPKNEAAYLALGEAHLAMGEGELATQVWRSGLENANPKSVLLHIRLAAGLIAQNALDEAEKTLADLDNLIKELGPIWRQEARIGFKNTAEFLWANVRMARGKPQESVGMLERLARAWSASSSDLIPEHNVWRSLGQSYAALGRWDQAADAFEKSANLTPGDPQPSLLAARAWENAGHLRRALEAYERAAKLNAGQGDWLSLARTHFQYQASLLPSQRNWTLFEKAMTQAEKIAEAQKPEERRTLLLMRADYWNFQAQETADSAEREAARGRAVEVLRQAEAQEPNSAELAQALVIAYERLEQHADADRMLSQLDELITDEGERAHLRARIQILRKEHEAARATIAKATQTASPGQQRALGLLLVQSYIDEGKSEEARRELKALHEKFPEEVRLIRYLADLALESGNVAELAKWESALRQVEGGASNYADYYQARRLLSQSKRKNDAPFQDAVRLQKALVEQRPHWSAGWLLKGLVEQGRGNIPLAVEGYQNAIARGDRSVATYQRLFQALVAANRIPEAEQHLARLKQRGWLTSNLENLEITIAAREGDWDRALATARRAAENRPNDPLAHLWLGQLLLTEEKADEAEAAFRQAVAANDKDVRGWNGLFSYYLKTGKADRARETLSELAAKAELSESQRVFVLAQGYELLGDTEDAKANYEKAAELEPNSVPILMRLANFNMKFDANRAEQALEKVVSLAPALNEARFALAAARAAKGDEASWQQALELIEKGDSADAAHLNQRFKVVLLLSRGGNANITEARGIAEQLVSGAAKPAAIDQLLLIRVYERESALQNTAAERGRILAKAENQYHALIAEQPDNPNYAAGYVDLLRRHNQGAKAEGWLRQLESAWLGKDAADWDKLVAYADFLLARRFNAAAAPVLGNLQKQLAAGNHGNSVRVAQFIELCLRADSPAQAAPWLNKLDELEPNSLQALAARVRWLKKDNKSDQAGPLVEAFARTVVANTMDVQQRAQLVLQLGNLCLHSELYAESERWYREYLRFQPDAYHTVALAMAKRGSVGQAIQFLERSAKQDDSIRPAIALAMVLVNSKPDAEAFHLADPIFAAALKKHATSSELLRSVADVHLMQGDTEKAKELYLSALKLEPNSIILLNNLAALTSEQKGRTAEATRYIDQALSIAGPQAALYDTKGMIRLYSGDAKQAAEFFETAAYLVDSDPRHHFHLAAAYDALGEKEKARAALEKSLQHDLMDQILTETDRRLLESLTAQLQ